MPYDPHADDEDERLPDGSEAGHRRRFNDFDCPDCNANNPYDDGFGDGDEIRCYYCGQGFTVAVSEEGRLRLRPE